MSTLDILPSQRHHFDIRVDITYLNCAYMSPLMHNVSKAMRDGVQAKAHPWEYTEADFFTSAETLRTLTARLINTHADDIALVPATSYGVQIAANVLPLTSHQEILVLADQFPSNIYAWREKAQQANAHMRTVNTDETGWNQNVLDAISDKTAIIALPAVHWSDGGMLDLVKISEKARAHNAALVLDLTQSLGALPFDIAKIKPDFMVASTYKWLMGPYGLGVLYISPKWQHAAPLEYNWINRQGSEDFSLLTKYQDSYQKGARRFDMGGRANPPLLNGAIVGLQQLLEWHVPRITQTLQLYTQDLMMCLQDIGLNTPKPHQQSPHLISVLLPPHKNTADWLAHLQQANIFLSIRQTQAGKCLRISPHLYNDSTDKERLLTALRALYARA